VSVAAAWWPEARTGELVGYLDDQEYERLLAVTEIAEAGAGDFLLHKGSPSRSILLVEDGEIEIIDESMGDMVVLGRVGAGGVVGEVGFVDGEPRTHHVRAATACRVRRLTRDALLALAQADPQLFAKVSLALAALMARRFRTVLAELDPLRAFAATLGEPDETGLEPSGTDGGGAGEAGAEEPAEASQDAAGGVSRAEAAGPEDSEEDGFDEGPIEYDEIEDPLLDQALDVLRELARRPAKDLAGV
jgi:CRP/FNR family cyclic AMP-dependent transcriptional regulator